MSDTIDDGNERAEFLLSVALANRKQRALIPTGFCFYCNEAVGARLFCDASCRDDYQEEQRLKQIGGRT